MVWNVITDFGDSAAMLPAAALLLAWLAATGRPRGAILWAGLFLGQAALVAATKIAFRGWFIGSEALNFTGISGHATLACSVIPIAAALLAWRAGPPARLAAGGLGLAAGLLIGVSRVALWQHSWSEVVAGCALGGLVALLFVLFSDPKVMSAGRAPRHLPTPAAAAMLAVLLLLMHGTRAPSDRLITRIALHLSGHSTPYTRYDFHDPWRWRMLGSAQGDARLTSTGRG